jgi:hypothetical protein
MTSSKQLAARMVSPWTALLLAADSAAEPAASHPADRPAVWRGRQPRSRLAPLPVSMKRPCQHKVAEISLSQELGPLTPEQPARLASAAHVPAYVGAPLLSVSLREALACHSPSTPSLGPAGVRLALHDGSGGSRLPPSSTAARRGSAGGAAFNECLRMLLAELPADEAAELAQARAFLARF